MVNLFDIKKLLGMRMTQRESSEFWSQNFKNCDFKDIFIACCDKFIGFPDTTEAVFPRIQVQLSIVYRGVISWAICLKKITKLWQPTGL